MKPLLILFVVVGLFAGCRSKDGDLTMFTTDDDRALGEQIAGQIASDPANFRILPPEEFMEMYVIMNGLLSDILQSEAILHRDEMAWQLRVIDNDTILNAFCTPGGFIYVYTGLINYVESLDELAGVMAHEVAHADLRHSTDQLTKAYGIRVLVNLLLSGDYEVLAEIGAGLLQLSFSRGDESEADLAAVRYLNDTNYDPKAFAGFFDRMSKQGGEMGPLQFLSTHPDPGNRVEKIHREWERLGSKQGADHTETFERLLSIMPDSSVVDQE